MPEKITSVDIAHAGSSLHYVDDWEGLLGKLCDYAPRYLLLADLLAGDQERFVTTQIYYESKVPVWFFNLNEIIQTLSALNYQLIYKSYLIRSYKGVSGELPMNNFPLDKQLKYPCQLLFKRG